MLSIVTILYSFLFSIPRITFKALCFGDRAINSSIIFLTNSCLNLHGILLLVLIGFSRLHRSMCPTGTLPSLKLNTNYQYPYKRVVGL